jgi:hypothetical protein
MLCGKQVFIIALLGLPVDFFNRLKKDHREVVGLLDQIKEFSEIQSTQREIMFFQVKQELVPHIRA